VKLNQPNLTSSLYWHTKCFKELKLLMFCCATSLVIFKAVKHQGCYLNFISETQAQQKNAWSSWNSSRKRKPQRQAFTLSVSALVWQADWRCILFLGEKILIYTLFGVSSHFVKNCKNRSRSQLVLCEAKQKVTSRLVGSKEKDAKDDPPFDWRKFFSLLRPHILHLLAAIAVIWTKEFYYHSNRIKK